MKKMLKRTLFQTISDTIKVRNQRCWFHFNLISRKYTIRTIIHHNRLWGWKTHSSQYIRLTFKLQTDCMCPILLHERAVMLNYSYFWNKLQWIISNSKLTFQTDKEIENMDYNVKWAIMSKQVFLLWSVYW